MMNTRKIPVFNTGNTICGNFIEIIDSCGSFDFEKKKQKKQGKTFQ